jgi:solute carrier family 25 ornithine transporter 2/15
MDEPSSYFRFRDSLSGCVGAACLVLAGAPFDVVKVRLQTAQRMYAGPIDCFQSMVRAEGVLSLWKGAGPAFSSALVENAVAFTVNGLLRRWVAPLDGSPIPVLNELFIGAFGGIFSATAICPSEVVKCRMQFMRSTDTPMYTGQKSAGGFQLFRNILTTEGARGLFAGLGPLLLRDVPFNAVFFGGYRAYLRVLAALLPSAPDGVLSFLSGGFAGMTAWAIVFPFDVVKSRQQVAGVSGKGITPSTWTTLAQIVAKGGIPTLYRGCSAAVMRGFPANAALFWGQQQSEKILQRWGMD